MNVIYESDLKIEKPFFSVCLETNNRGNTIFRALESLLKQGTGDFECVVVDDCSTDQTLSEIKRFIASPSYLNFPFSLSVFQNSNHLGGVLNWNGPLKFVKGKYIVVLEGDDCFQPDHLKKAHEVLSKTPSIGIYATGSQRALRPIKGFIASIKYFQYTYQIINVSPPSETIFIRSTKNGIPYQYDVINNTYAPELQLYLTISGDGWDAFHTSSADVYREPSTSFTNLTWRYFDDKFKIIEKFSQHKNIDRVQVKKTFRRQYILAVRRYLVSDFQKKGDPESIKNGIKKILKNKSFPMISFYSVVFSTILLLKKIKVFDLYFRIKKA